ncbi:MAG TPA: tail fiber protein [Puia sp.]|nr:tail fiber protein [Puia sp.]
METFLATILLWPVNFAPVGWALCAGQLLAISQNSALFALLGTTYGGNGSSTFGLPDFRGRIPVGAGQGPGLATYLLGEMSGTENVTLLVNQMPAHLHPVALSVTVSASNAQATTSVPAASNSLAAPYDALNFNPIAGYNTTAPNTPLNIGGGAVNGNTGLTGGSLPHSNLQPFTVVNYIIALTGIFPSRG